MEMVPLSIAAFIIFLVGFKIGGFFSAKRGHSLLLENEALEQFLTELNNESPAEKSDYLIL